MATTDIPVVSVAPRSHEEAPLRSERYPGPWFIAGGPGSGKTTLSLALAERFGRGVYASSDAVRAVDPDSIVRGELGDRMPVLARMLQDLQGEHDLIVDGAPRTPDQAVLVPDDGIVIYLWCQPTIALDRLRLRGRVDDTDELAHKRVEQQYGADDGWVRELATWNRCLNTSHRTAEQVFRSVELYLTGQRREVF